MEPQKEPHQDPEPRKEEKERKRRFQIVKLEERIAPGCHPGPHYTGPSGCPS